MSENKKLIETCTGLQHIGIPTADFAQTCSFYEGLGFEVLHEKVIRGIQKVAFLGFQDVVLEVYEEEGQRSAGSIDHIAFNCTDIEKAYREAQQSGYQIVSDGIEELPFWENGVRYFIILGPNGERLEWNQRL